jgi:hypothetical protein
MDAPTEQAYRVLTPVGKKPCHVCFGTGNSIEPIPGRPGIRYGRCKNPDCTAPARRMSDLTTILRLSLNKVSASSANREGR